MLNKTRESKSDSCFVHQGSRVSDLYSSPCQEQSRLVSALNGDQSVVRPLFLLLLLSAMLIFAVAAYSALRGDDDLRGRETHQIESLVRFQQEQLAQSLTNLGTTLPLNTTGIQENAQPAFDLPADWVFVFNNAGDVLFTPAESPVLSRITAPQAWRQSLGLLAQSARSRNTSTDVVAVNGQVYIAAAKSIECQDTSDCLVLALTDLMGTMQDVFENGLQLGGYKVAISHQNNTDNFVAPLKNKRGEIIAWHEWRGSHPGKQRLQSLLPWLALIVLFTAIICFAVTKRATQIAKLVEKANEEASHKALHDPLTGLANRSLLQTRLNEAINGFARSGKGFAFHMIDLDRFKEVNDTMGHPAGDALICEAAKRLRSVCRLGDTVARLGGDEFAIIQLDAASGARASRLARRALEQLAEVYQIENTPTFVTGSIGVAVVEQHGLPQEEIIRQADIALYRAKSSGRNQFSFFEEEIDRQLREKRSIETDLRQAILDDQLHVVYQPQVSSDGRHVRSFEALVRWNHAERGVVSPATFVPVAEDSGLIRDLGKYVMKHAFATASKWPEITMAVNVSACELHYPDYAEQVISIARASRIRPDQIELEITESVLLENSARVTRTLKSLKDAGFHIALDDFGTGYSSLSYLRRHQIDKLKIDQSFVASIGVREDAGAVVQAIINLGEALGLSVTAEGVENATQRDALKARGCAYLQGYFFSRPIMANQIPDLMSDYNKTLRIA